MTRHLYVQCEHCGRVRLPSGLWTRDASLEPDTVGICKTCGDWRARLAKVREVREVRRTQQRCEAGFGPAPEGVDVWAGFREGE